MLITPLSNFRVELKQSRAAIIFFLHKFIIPSRGPLLEPFRASGYVPLSPPGNVGKLAHISHLGKSMGSRGLTFPLKSLDHSSGRPFVPGDMGNPHIVLTNPKQQCQQNQLPYSPLIRLATL